MRYYFISIAVLILVIKVCLGVPPGGISNNKIRSNPIFTSAGDPCTGCSNETFEGTGTVLDGWKYGDGTAGIVTNVDYATAPAPLSGSQSLMAKNANSQQAQLQLTVPNVGEIWMRCIVTLTNTIVNNMRLLRVDDNVGGVMLSIEVQSSGLRAVSGTGNATTVSTLSADTKYYLWCHYKKGTGANGVADVAFSTTKTRPTSGNNFAQTSAGSTTGNANDVFMNVVDVSFGPGVIGVIYDDWSFSSVSQPGDFP
jgi:hypothetical protein